jgi:Mrp family chromosome partitioning ATPase
MQRLLDLRFEQKSRISQLEATGVGANMPMRTSAAAMLAATERQIEDRKRELAGDPSSNSSTSSAPAGETIAAKKIRLEAQRESLQSNLDGLTKQISEVEKLRVQEAHIQRDLEATEESIHQRKVETQTFRLDQSIPDRPLVPYHDLRIAFSAGGGIGGILIAFGVMAFAGFMDRRVLDPADTNKDGRRYPVLGVLPQLPEDLANPEQVAVAAHGVHEIRNRLQLADPGGAGQQVFAITGAVAGSGKTSLTLGLGLSFASAGCNTLIIDGDLVGGGLSSRINAIVRRKIGQVLLREGLVTVEQLQQALTQGRASGRRVGEMLVQLGYVAEADLLAAIERQGRDAVGLLDAIGGENLDDCTIATGIANLTALPLGAATSVHAGMISGAAMGGLIDRARREFDIILIDTGPIPGSIEASIAAANADTVVLVVARGDTRPDVERSLSYLRQLPVRFAGLVFNRARKRDIERYGSSRVSNSESQNPEADVPSVELPGSLRFGPIPRSVVSRGPRNPGSFRSN